MVCKFYIVYVFPANEKRGWYIGIWRKFIPYCFHYWLFHSIIIKEEGMRTKTFVCKVTKTFNVKRRKGILRSEADL